jgi:hypothetical protein
MEPGLDVHESGLAASPRPFEAERSAERFDGVESVTC